MESTTASGSCIVCELKSRGVYPTFAPSCTCPGNDSGVDPGPNSVAGFGTNHNGRPKPTYCDNMSYYSGVDHFKDPEEMYASLPPRTDAVSPYTVPRPDSSAGSEVSFCSISNFKLNFNAAPGAVDRPSSSASTESRFCHRRTPSFEYNPDFMRTSSPIDPDPNSLPLFMPNFDAGFRVVSRPSSTSSSELSFYPGCAPSTSAIPKPNFSTTPNSHASDVKCSCASTDVTPSSCCEPGSDVALDTKSHTVSNSGSDASSRPGSSASSSSDSSDPFTYFEASQGMALSVALPLSGLDTESFSSFNVYGIKDILTISQSTPSPSGSSDSSGLGSLGSIPVSPDDNDKASYADKTPVPDIKVMYQGRDILDLKSNIDPAGWSFQHAKLPPNSPTAFFTNRSQYHRLTYPQIEFDYDTCDICGFRAIKTE